MASTTKNIGPEGKPKITAGKDCVCGFLHNFRKQKSSRSLFYSNSCSMVFGANGNEVGSVEFL